MLREIMKLEYLIINDPNHRELLDVFSNDLNALKFTFSMLDVDNAGVTFEAVLQLSVFVLRKGLKEEVKKMIKDNKDNIIGFLEDY